MLGSSVARKGRRGGNCPPHCQAEYGIYHVFNTFETNFCTELKKPAPPQYWQFQIRKTPLKPLLFFGLQENLDRKIVPNLEENFFCPRSPQQPSPQLQILAMRLMPGVLNKFFTSFYKKLDCF